MPVIDENIDKDCCEVRYIRLKNMSLPERSLRRGNNQHVTKLSSIITLVIPEYRPDHKGDEFQAPMSPARKTLLWSPQKCIDSIRGEVQHTTSSSLMSCEVINVDSKQMTISVSKCSAFKKEVKTLKNITQEL